MHNPFTEMVDESTDYDLIEQSNNGSQSAVEKLVLRHQAWIYNIAIRMVFHPHDAEEVTQEVLIKAITRLSTFNGQSKFRTWLYRITANHVLNMKRRGGEKESQTFSSYADAINGTPDLDLPDPKTVPDKQGDLWVYQHRYEYSANGYRATSVPVAGDRLRSDRQPNLHAPLPEDFALLADSGLMWFHAHMNRARYQYGGAHGRNQYFDTYRGDVLVYDFSTNPPLRGSISRSGFHPTADPIGERFNGPAAALGTRLSSSLINAGYEPLWADRDGIYQLDHEQGTIKTIVELPIESATILLSQQGTVAIEGNESSESTTLIHLYVESDMQAHLFTLTDAAGKSDWFQSTEELGSMRPLPTLQAIEERTFSKLPTDISGSYPMLVQTPDGKLIAFARYSNYERAVLADTPDATWEQERLVAPDMPVTGRVASACMVALTPPGGLLIIGISSWLYAVANDLPMPTTLGVPAEYLPGIITISILATLTSMTVVWWLARRRGLSRSACWAWSLGSLMLGLAGPLMVIALYRRVHREPCPRCERLRQIDRNTCSNCGSIWEPMQAEGLEIIDSDSRFNATVQRANAELGAT